MCTAGLSINKLLSALLEANFSPAGMKWPKAVAPFEVAIVPLGNDPTGPAWALSKSVWGIVRSLSNSVVFDDRERNARSKILEHQLLGIPLCIFSGAVAVQSGNLEFCYSDRPSPEMVPIADLGAAIKRAFPD